MLYKFIFNLVIPLYKSSKVMRQKMNEMNSRMQQQERHTMNEVKQPKGEPAPKVSKEDYIDYEEIK